MFPDLDFEQLKQYGLIGVVIYAAWFYRATWWPWVQRLLGNGGSAAPSLQDATGHVSALIDYFGKVGCAEGVKAARTAGECLFHETHSEHKT